MRKILISSLIIAFTQFGIAQEGVRSIKKNPNNPTEVKKTNTTAVNNERTAAQDSTKTNNARTNKPKKNTEKTSQK